MGDIFAKIHVTLLSHMPFCKVTFLLGSISSTSNMAWPLSLALTNKISRTDYLWVPKLGPCTFQVNSLRMEPQNHPLKKPLGEQEATWKKNKANTNCQTCDWGHYRPSSPSNHPEEGSCTQPREPSIKPMEPGEIVHHSCFTSRGWFVSQQRVAKKKAHMSSVYIF